LIDVLPSAPALDAGCGSGLLAQAWVALGRGPVRAIDIDPRAVMHACMSIEAAGLSGDARVERLSLGALAPDALTGRILLANLPPPGHAALFEALTAPPRAALVSGVRASLAAPVLEGYRRLGLRPAGIRRAGPWAAWVLHSTRR
jgi:ribosomal protein L11 methyltransferase